MQLVICVFRDEILLTVNDVRSYIATFTFKMIHQIGFGKAEIIIRQLVVGLVFPDSFSVQGVMKLPYDRFIKGDLLQLASGGCVGFNHPVNIGIDKQPNN